MLVQAVVGETLCFIVFVTASQPQPNLSLDSLNRTHNMQEFGARQAKIAGG